MLSITTNLSSLITQSSMNTSTNKLNQAIERMSTGFKINHAKDNAANYSINTSLSSKISAYQIAEDNCAMGLDMVQTASSNLETMSNLTSRLRALATQAQNGTYGDKSLDAINSEANALVEEINRIYETAEYNGRKLFKTESNPVSAISTYALSRAVTTETGFIQEIDQRDTSAMTKLASVDANTAISSGTYSISTAEELAKLATMTNNGLVTGGEFVLANNIDLSVYSNWTPIGTYDPDNDTGYRFSGSFDGNGCVISNLTITEAPTVGYVGLFSTISGDIKNLGIEDAYIDIDEVRSSVGILVGLSSYSADFDSNNIESGTIQNCYATGSVLVVTEGYAGGLVGANFRNILKFDSCYSAVDIDYSDGSGYSTIGGLLGSSVAGSVDIQNCYTTGNINANGDADCGGLVGSVELVYVTIKNSFSTGIVSATGTNAGGLFGSLYGYTDSVVNCSYNSVNSKGIGDDYNGYGASGVTAKSESELRAMIPTLYKYGGATSSGSTMSDFVLQIGINGDTSSQISFNTSLELENINSLRAIERNTTTDYLSKIDSMLNVISEKQTEFGSIENRLTSALEQIAVSYDNLVSTRSTIRDADVAEESSAYIRNQILQQAAATLMATANQTPSIALQLL